MAAPTAVASVQREWDLLAVEIKALEDKHNDYVTKLNEVHKEQGELLKTLKINSKQLTSVKEKLRKLQLRDDLSADEVADVADLQAETAEKRTRIIEMQDTLPRESNGLYLNIVLGDVDVSLLNKRDRFRYKDNYEQFKLVVTLVAMVMTLLAIIFQRRIFDAVLHFLLVWYYCTLTIRESILRINGSKIKGWWVTHHYIAAVLCGVLITWPDRQSYLEFRGQFNVFTMYLSMVQLMQYFYQRGCLYRLRSLGVRDDMDVTVEGFQSWMFRGLSFLLPFLIFGYLWQIYMAYLLFGLARKSQEYEWQVYAMCILFLVVAAGNIVTTLSVVKKKVVTADKPHQRRRLETKYSLDVPVEEKKQE